MCLFKDVYTISVQLGVRVMDMVFNATKTLTPNRTEDVYMSLNLFCWKTLKQNKDKNKWKRKNKETNKINWADKTL
jgi:hypothetical protein